MTDQDHIDRINALTRNARTTWLALLGVLVFVGITLMGVEHIDFYGVNRATKLPLVDVEVPTRYFFVAAPILTAAIYGYFHLYLIRLWDALGAAPSRVNGNRLGDAVAPWLVTDAALHWRRRVRGDNATTPRALEWGAMLLNFLLAWVFGLIILFLLWRLSMPARTFWMTAISGVCFGVSFILAASSMAMLMQRMRLTAGTLSQTRWSYHFETIGIPFTLCVLLWESYEVTGGNADRLSRVNLHGKHLVERPANWLPYEIVYEDFGRSWCPQKGKPQRKGLTDNERKELRKAWGAQREITRADLVKPSWHHRETILDLRHAWLYRSFLVGAYMARAELEGATLRKADMEGVVLHDAKMRNTNMYKAQMAGTDLTLAKLNKGWLYKTQLTHSTLVKTELSSALVYKPVWEGAMLDDVDLRYALVFGGKGEEVKLNDTPQEGNISGVTNKTFDGAALRYVDLSSASFADPEYLRNVFFDGSVTLPPGAAEKLRSDCKRFNTILSDKEFFGQWRGWLKIRGVEWTGENGVAPPYREDSEETFYDWRDVEAISPKDAGCG